MKGEEEMGTRGSAVRNHARENIQISCDHGSDLDTEVAISRAPRATSGCESGPELLLWSVITMFLHVFPRCLDRLLEGLVHGLFWAILEVHEQLTVLLAGPLPMGWWLAAL